MANNNKTATRNRWVMIITFWTFILAILISIVAQYLFGVVESFLLALLILLLVVFVGILFDMIGIAATVAEEAPLLAKAARRVYGAREALFLIRNADRFANFCNDVIGDIAGIISGGLSAYLVLRLVGSGLFRENPLLSVSATGLISALTVGGKGLGKAVALDRSTEIILWFAAVLARIESFLPGRLFFGKGLPPKRK